MLKYAEDLNFRAPIRVRIQLRQKSSSLLSLLQAVNNYDSTITFVDRVLRFLHLSPNPFLSEAPRRYYDLHTSVFEASKQDRFMCDDHFPVHFTNTQRSFAVHEILQTTPFGRIEKGEIGIDRLVRERIFQAAYPLHEGDYKFDNTEQPDSFAENNPRRILYDTWARYRLFYKYQPLDLIRDYFGEKVGLYFAWLGKRGVKEVREKGRIRLGLYTAWLLPASLVGFLVFLFGFIYLANNQPARDVCTIGRNITMCPICDQVENS